MLELADIIRRHGSAFVENRPVPLLSSQRRALFDIEHCRDGFFGGHVYQCTDGDCGELHYAYHSCRNRSCPKCHASQTEAWLQARRTELLPSPYFHLVFTIPRELHAVAGAHQKEVYAIIMREAAASLRKLARDPKYLGGDVGILEVLHTWTRAMLYHPHVHCLVPGGALTEDNTWVHANPAFLVPVKALAMIFRGKVRDALEQAELLQDVPPSAWTKNWVVFSKPAIQGPEKILQYLGRYVHRIAIVNSRILKCDEGEVAYQYHDPRKGKRLQTLPPHQFLERFIRHVLPPRFSKVRYYGLWAPANRKRFRSLQLALGLLLADPRVPGSSSSEEAAFRGPRCPVCGAEVVAISRLHPQRRPSFSSYPSAPRAPP